ncbi:MAG: sugar phosphate isomerase/epimerase family protein [Armatimonadota bacterium]
MPALLLATDFNNADPSGERDWVVGAAEAAATLGVPALRIDAMMTGERDLPLAERQERFAAAMRDIVERTSGLPVVFGIENHGIQGNDPEFLEGLMDRVGSTRIGMTLDTGNFYWAGHPLEDVYRILARLAPRTVHTHVKNIAYPAEVRQARREAGWEYGRYVCPIPDGDIDHARVVALLAHAGYTGDLCIEDESLDRFPVAVRVEHVRAAAEHLRACIASAPGNLPPAPGVFNG